MRIFDFEQNMNQYDDMRVEDETLHYDGAELRGVTFRNYPILRLNDLMVSGCSFVNCKVLYFTDCQVADSMIKGSETIYADRSLLKGGILQDMRCDNDCLLSLEDTRLDGCSFLRLELSNGAYLVNGIGDVWAEKCSFRDIRTDREDKELFFCEETRGVIFKKKQQFCIVDKDSCKGWDQVVYAGDLPDAPKDVLEQAVENGLLTEETLADIRRREGRDCEADWDAETLKEAFGLLDVMVRTFNCLTRAGVQTVGDAAKMPVEQIVQVRNMGRRTAADVAARLREKGIAGTDWEYFL